MLIAAVIAVQAALVVMPASSTVLPAKPEAFLQTRAALHSISEHVVAPECPILRSEPTFGISLIDVQTGQPLCERNADGIAQPTSTTKVMAALLTAKYLQAQHLGLDTTITVQPADKQIEWDAAAAYLQVGQRYTVHSLLAMASILSAADAVMALARFVAGSRAAFLAEMNSEAHALGMDHTHYNSPYGYASTAPGNWQDGESPLVGNYSSAHDMALLMAAFAQYPDEIAIFGATTYHEGSVWLNRSSGDVITDSWIGLSTPDGVATKNLHLPFQVLAVKKGCMWCQASLQKISYVMLVRFRQRVVAAAFLYTTQNYTEPRVSDMLATLLWAFHQCGQPAYMSYC
jgi:D-alanyl-D-alanine carboxypeptidase